MANYFENVKTLNDLKAEYRRLAMANHPDLGGSTAVMQEINAAYDRLFAELKDAHNAAADEEHQTNEMPNEFRDIITALLRMDGLKIELCGCWLWITGNTRAHKDELKALGCHWSQQKAAWSWHHRDPGARWYRGKRTMQEIRRKYGTIGFANTDSAVAVV